MVQTNTGKSARLLQYYEHWEKKVFQALVKVRGAWICTHIHVHCSMGVLLIDFALILVLHSCKQ